MKCVTPGSVTLSSQSSEIKIHHLKSFLIFQILNNIINVNLYDSILISVRIEFPYSVNEFVEL